MRIAIISDIHANLEALTAVLDDIEKQHIDHIICLGDIIGYGPNPNECIDLVKKFSSLTLLGNHDAAALDPYATQNFNINAKIAIEWTQNTLSKESKLFIRSLPNIKIQNNNTYVHATPYEPQMWYYITTEEDANYSFHFFHTKCCFVGHTHSPIIMSPYTDLFGKQKIKIIMDQEFELDTEEKIRYLINVGSVGQPRDRNPKASYGIFDSENLHISINRIVYDIKKCQDKMKKCKLPEFLILRIAEGK